MKKLCAYTPEDGIQTLPLMGLSLCIVYDKNLKPYVFENRCSHKDRPLDKSEWNKDTLQLICPFHKAIFSLENEGKCISGPTEAPLVFFPSEVIEGFIYIQL